MDPLDWLAEARRDRMPPVCPHFDIKFTARNVRVGKGRGVGGVREMDLIHEYAEGLERAYAALRGKPFCRQTPLVLEGRNKTLVEVLEISDRFPDKFDPLTTLEPHTTIPCILLPCRTRFPTRKAELEYAVVAAAHEATHVFNFRKRHPRDPNTFGWEWFDEGTAVFMERQLFPQYRNYLEYSLDWCDRPERPLDDGEAWYQSQMFVRYLAALQDEAFLSEVWMCSLPHEKPLEAIDRLLKARGVPADQRADLFATYCLHSYLLRDPSSYCHAPDVYERHGGRALRESFELPTGNTIALDDALEHLSCHYYRFYRGGRAGAIQFRWSPAHTHSADLHATAAVVDADGRRGVTEPLPLGSPASLLAEADHVVLVVSNSARSGAALPYRIEVVAI